MDRKTITILMMLVFPIYFVSAQVKIEVNTCIELETGTTLDISGGDLILGSNVSGDASLIDNGSVTYSDGGIAKVQRYLTDGEWHMVSSPVGSAVSGMFSGDYLQYHSEFSNDWTDIEPTNTSLGIMQGYSLWTVNAAPTTEVFSGTTNTGTIDKAFTQNGAGWNLIGNPYPSTLDWDAVTIPAELNGAIWLFDPTIGANGDYRYYINAGGAANTTTQFIASGQGFFVRSTGGSGTLTLDNSTRVHGGQTFYKDYENSAMVLFKVSGNDITTQTAIRFNENATQEIDRLYDVYRIISDSPEVPMLFTKAENENMAINTLPAIDGNEIVPMWFKAGTDGSYTISTNEITGIDNETPIYIEDLNSGIIQNLREIPEYTFGYKSGSDHGFIIYFTEPENKTQSGQINIYAYDNVLNVNFPVSELTNDDFKAQIMVFDITGKAILQNSTTNIKNQISLKGNNSIFMVKVVSVRETANRKVFIK